MKLLLDTVAASPIVHAYNVVLDKRTPRAGLIRGDLYFADGSRLHFRELAEIQANVVRQKPDLTGLGLGTLRIGQCSI